MQFLTSIVLSAFVGYSAAWYLGFVEGNFALLLFMATVVTGIYWLAERFYFLPQRQQAAARLQAEAVKRQIGAASSGNKHSATAMTVAQRVRGAGNVCYE